ncbi:MAG: hypothetical protein AAB288_14495 [Acidobacteriota bacterium]
MTPMAPIEVFGRRGRIVLEAIIDTGFEGHVCIPAEEAVKLGLELIDVEEMTLADGSVADDFVFAGTVRFLGKTVETRIAVTRGSFSLIGTKLLHDCTLTIDFSKPKVTCIRSETRRKK